MSRLKVTPKGKVKKNIPVTRVGRKQYLKRRFAHVRAVDVAGINNHFTQKYFEGSHTAAQSFTRLGLSIDPSAPKKVQEERKRKIKPNSRRKLEEEDHIKLQAEYEKANKIGRPVSEQEGSTIANLIQRYGTDLKRMTLDRKLNPFQLNARQLQRQVVNYLKWEKASFPKEFAAAEANGWFSLEQFADPKLRVSQNSILHSAAATAADAVAVAVSSSSSNAKAISPTAAKKKKAAKKN